MDVWLQKKLRQEVVSSLSLSSLLFFPFQKVNMYPLNNYFVSGVCADFGWRSL
uniref:Uncharacterized protein n=1 Tax=Arundo donax TaxID=35708 RepID=A0A0A9EHI6_ARUDO